MRCLGFLLLMAALCPAVPHSLAETGAAAGGPKPASVSEAAAASKPTAAPEPASSAEPKSLANPTSFAAARVVANRVLAREEFRAEAEPSWLDRGIAWAEGWLFALLQGMGDVGAHNPWIAPVLEWLCFGLAAACLLVFVHRSLRRQVVRLSFAGALSLPSETGLQGTDWMGEAARYEAEGRGREALHCLYWAAIALLEARKAWRPNATRTPREYLRLLRPGSETQRLLGALTRRFERTWYGSEEATAESLQAARREFASLATLAAGDAAGSNGEPPSSAAAGAPA